jgi:hypothetical protein
LKGPRGDLREDLAPGYLIWTACNTTPTLGWSGAGLNRCSHLASCLKTANGGFEITRSQFDYLAGPFAGQRELNSGVEESAACCDGGTNSCETSTKQTVIVQLSCIHQL